MADIPRKLSLPVLGPSAKDDDDLPSRRRFLALFGASAALATGAGCKPSQDRANVIPYTKKQEEILPGVADFYASTMQLGEIAYPVLVKAREGRPILVEGNDEHPRYRGKTSLHAIADVLGLYDPDRLREPRIDGRAASWDAAIGRLVDATKRSAGKSVVLVTGANLSPTRRGLIARLANAVPGLRHLQWEPAADHAGRQAEQALHGDVRLPLYRFERAKVVVALEADFLSTHGDMVSASAGFASLRRPASFAGGMNRLYVLEGGHSLTGAAADVRLPVRPSHLARLAFALVRELHRRGQRALPEGMDASALDAFALDGLPEAKPWRAQLDLLVDDLHAAGSSSLVLAGPAASPEAHAAALILNRMLGTDGTTTSDEATLAPGLATPDDMAKLVGEMAAGQVAAVVLWDGNPAYDAPAGASASPGGWRAAMAKVPVRVRLGLHADETAADCDVILPTNHWLESWNDFETSPDALTLQQPLIAPLFGTWQGEDVLLRWLDGLGRPAEKRYQDVLKRRWETEVQPKGSPVPFRAFWNACLHDGLLRRKSDVPARTLDGAACTRFARQAAGAPQSPAFELVLDTDARLYDGRFANNGWLQEMPDQMTQVAWDNPLSVAPADAERLRAKTGDLVSLGSGPPIPIVVQPGQAQGVLRLRLGHGRWEGTVAAHIGTRAWELVPRWGERVVAVARVSATGRSRELVFAQGHGTRDGRDLARTMTMAEFAKQPQRAREPVPPPSLYENPMAKERKEPRWGMAIDLSACTGCGACVVACQSENNVPVVGPEQARKGRAMHWLRIDRYYEDKPDDKPSPAVVHEPMLCQHCDHAPCETVCPVEATHHGPDGINQMAYNRCVGTRYCANNCPYKVRRFNYLDFTGETPPSLQLAYNPEVSVRPRGVMEKCTFCVQRISNAKQVAKRDGRELRGSDVVTACAAACPTSAIVFGDINDPKGDVWKLARSNRGFRVLEELGTRPAITYLAQLKNPSGEDKT